MSERKHLRLGRAEQTELLQRVIRRSAHAEGAPTPVVVLDLDGTLMDNRPRTCAILHDFARSRPPRDSELAARLLAVTPDQLAYLFTDSLARLGIHRMEEVAELEVFWRERFFADAHLQYDVEVPGAVAFARACYEAGAILVYLTGRDLPLMGIGTFQSLRDLGFPIGLPGTELVLKPDAAMPDEAFKRLTAPTLGRIGEIVAVFDNEPGNCNVFRKAYPGADTVLIDTQCMPGAPPPDEGVHVIADFGRLAMQSERRVIRAG
jgi:hypothetical protein